MSPQLRCLMFLPLVAGVACSSSTEPSPVRREAPVALSSSRNNAQFVTVLTRNLYVGADLDAVIAAILSPDPSDDLPALTGAIQTLFATDFPTRAAALANEIARSRPHAVGMQEVSTIDIDLTPLGLPIVVHQDFLSLLQQALAARGLTYQVAATNHNFTVTPFPGISLADADVLLVDESRVTVLNALGSRYSTNLGVIAPGVDLQRGWVLVQAVIDRTEYVIASTHLESGSFPGFDLLRAAQATELATILASYPRAILMGDLNDGPGSPMYQVLAGAGYADVWATLRPQGEGLTCCHVADLSDARPDFNQRIDYILARGIEHPRQGVLGQVSLVGLKPWERLTGPLHSIWASDHAGILADLLTPSAAGLTD